MEDEYDSYGKGRVDVESIIFLRRFNFCIARKDQKPGPVWMKRLEEKQCEAWCGAINENCVLTKFPSFVEGVSARRTSIVGLQ